MMENKKIVFLINCGDGYENEIEDGFSNEQKALEYINFYSKNLKGMYKYTISKMEIDKSQDYRTSWFFRIDSVLEKIIHIEEQITPNKSFGYDVNNDFYATIKGDSLELAKKDFLKLFHTQNKKIRNIKK